MKRKKMKEKQRRKLPSLNQNQAVNQQKKKRDCWQKMNNQNQEEDPSLLQRSCQELGLKKTR